MSKKVFVFANPNCDDPALIDLDLESIKAALNLTNDDQLIAMQGISSITIHDAEKPQSDVHMPGPGFQLGGGYTIYESAGSCSQMVHAPSMNEVLELRERLFKPTQTKEEIRMRGAELIAAERQRQIDVEGWTVEHDDEYKGGQLRGAAICYLGANTDMECNWLGKFWPWEMKWWKKSPDDIRNLVKAGALIAAEIDRLQRLKGESHE